MCLLLRLRVDSSMFKLFGERKWNAAGIYVAIFFLSFNSALVYSNPAITPRIFPEDITMDAFISHVDLTVVRGLIKSNSSLGEMTSDLDKEIDKLSSDIANVSEAEKKAELYIEIEKIELLKEAISNVNDCSVGSSSALTEVCEVIENEVKQNQVPSAIENYELYINANKSSITEYFIDRVIGSISRDIFLQNQNEIIAALIDMKRSIIINDSFDELVTVLSSESDQDRRKNYIKSFFGNYLSIDEQDLNQRTNTKSASISYADSLYKDVLAKKVAHKQDIWKSKFWIWNYLKYSDNLSKSQLSTFGGIVLGSSESSQTVKINALEYDIYFSDKWRLPLTLYFAEVVESSDANETDVSRTKLLDSEMGTFNLSLSSIAKFRIFEFCNFSNGYGCYFPLQFGVRALKLPSEEPSDGEEGTSDEHTFGGYASIGLNTVFPIT